MQRNIWLLADHPAVVRYWRDVKEIACSQLENAHIVESGRRCAGQHKANVLDPATGGANTRTDVLAPFPTRLVGGAPDRHASKMYQLESPFLQDANFIRRFEALKDNRDLLAIHSTR